MPRIYVDGDACPVKDEVYRVAKRYGIEVKVVANAGMFVPEDALVELVVVGEGFDAADDWIVEHADAHDIVISDDIPLAARCLKKGAAVLGSKGREFTEASIGDALASREFLSMLRDHGLAGGGPAPFGPKDRSQFLQRLDALVCAALRKR